VRGQRPRLTLPAIAAVEAEDDKTIAAGAAHVALVKAVRGRLLTLEQEHEAASHQDPNELISSRTCHVCAGIDEVWTALKAAEAHR
jgi:hypothetical protein